MPACAGGNSSPHYPLAKPRCCCHHDVVAIQRVQVECEGIVQGVGFRPFVHKLAIELGLAGWVLNSSAGVVIQLEGDAAQIHTYLERLRNDAPPLSRVLALRWRELPPLGLAGFEIKPSATVAGELTLLCPDVALCADCRRELFDPADRRYRYPFINCTNCGPRYTIVRSLPYDRPATTMAHFELCPGCAAEYRDVKDRRYHAQPVACPACGPRIWCEPDPGPSGGRALETCVDVLRSGGIAAIKGLGGFHLACLANSDDAVLKLRQRKQRSFFKPLAVMVQDLASAQQICSLARADEAWLHSPQSPILLAPLKPDAVPQCISPYVAPRLDRLGIMLPYTPLHELILAELQQPIVLTSANLSDEPIIADNTGARQKLTELADCLLMHDRPILARCDDSVLASSDGAPVMLRQSRGFTPFPAYLATNGPDVLALGGDIKTTFAASRGNFAFISPHLGDAEHLETYAFFRDTWAHYQRLFGLKPEAVACDLHPGYHTARWAQELTRELAVPLIRVQHHHAHLAALLAERNLAGPRTAIVADGTGYGSDGGIWGGEILHGDSAGYTRTAHMRPLPLLGGERAVRQPWRIALGLLQQIEPQHAVDYIERVVTGALHERLAGECSERILESANPSFKPLERSELEQAQALLAADFGTVNTTALGRLFDGVAALLGITLLATYEGQAPMELEALARPATSVEMPLGLVQPSRPLDWQHIVAWLATTDAPISARAWVFHQWTAQALVTAALHTPQGIPSGQLLATGGCLQNTLLREMLASECGEHGLELITHREVPANDGGLSLGVLAVARALAIGSTTP